MIPKIGVPNTNRRANGMSDKTQSEILEEQKQLEGFTNEINSELLKINANKLKESVIEEPLVNNKPKVKLPSLSVLLEEEDEQEPDLEKNYKEENMSSVKGESSTTVSNIDAEEDKAEDIVVINGKKFTKKQIEELRKTKTWKTYFNTLRPRDQKGQVKSFPKYTSSRGMSEEDYKNYIDKMVLMKIDSKNPGNTFDEFYRTFKK